MKKIALLMLCAGLVHLARADHITGGEMFYTYTGFSNGENQYSVTLKLFMRCNSDREFSDPTIVTIFDKLTGNPLKDVSVKLANQETIGISNTNPCIMDAPPVCYVVGYFYFGVSLPPSAHGYLLASQVNYRVIGINNLGSYIQIGATYTTEIPGDLAAVTEAPKNNSAHFEGTDLVIVCENNSFSYSFAATDKDGDQLRYFFCNAYEGGNTSTPGNSLPASNPPYVSVPYGLPDFSGSNPLGSRVHINPETGLISGIAPAAGKYVVTVCVQEIRNGVVIATQRKDLQINIAACSIAAATLQDLYTICDNTATITLTDKSTSPLIKTYNWQLFNLAGTNIFSSALATPTYTFPDTGRYTIKLSINHDNTCSDTASAPVNVYPGFKPACTISGICISNPTTFTDASTSAYGAVTSWSWDFGELFSSDDYAFSKTAAYTYPTAGTKNVRLIVTDSKGCVDTLLKTFEVIDKPVITLAFRDTLICATDKVQLGAAGTGTFSWTPSLNIINAGSPSPVVAPLVSTTYFAGLNAEGCKNTDSVVVRVIDHVSLQAMADTTVCSTDIISLHLASDGLQYSWTPSLQLTDANKPNPVASVQQTTLFEVTATTGSCTAKDQVLVTAVPYPIVNAGADTIVCYNTPAQLQGSTNGSSLLWTPASSLSNGAILNPVARPAITTVYIVAAFDTKGCPKPALDTVIVTVLPTIAASAGHDTVIVTNQPLQLLATGGLSYLWSPALHLSNNSISNPIAVIPAASADTKYKVMVYNKAGCVDSAFIHIKVYGTLPSVFVPTAFSPNGDGKNDVLHPVAAGIQRLESFKVYNRWGQMVFSSTGDAAGWNGRVAGKDQPADAYVWIVQAIDYNNTVYSKKGVVVLVR